MRVAYAALVTVLLAPDAAEAQAPSSAPEKHATAQRVPSGSIHIDGHLNEEMWQAAAPLTDFVQAEPVEGAAPSTPIDVRFVYDDDALYVGARMSARSRSDIQAPMGRRDDTGQAEQIFVSIDTYHDRRTAYTFGVTATGVRLDHYHATDNRNSRDRGFDPVWEARVSIDDRGWTAEMKIPFNQLRFAGSGPQVWGLNVYRAVPSRNEEIYWAPIRRTDRVWASRFGELHGIDAIEPSRRVEILPYVSAGSTTAGQRNAQNPFARASDLDARTGVDVKLGLSSNLTLDATANPDFGQVEADPAEVNLTAFETFFTERRPFFTEGSRLFNPAGSEPWAAPNGAYFYSRRIGARPPGSARADYVDAPLTSTIVGAGKVTGRLASGTSIGVLGAVTSAESARTYDLPTAAFGRVPVAATTTYGVGRLQQEFGRGSTAGLMITTTRRDLAASNPLAALLTRNAFTASGDSLLRLRNGEYELGFELGVSRVSGEPAALARLQRASARYFQRPDARHVTYDPTRTSLTGFKGAVTAERAAGRHWLWNANATLVSPEFEINDVGRLSRADMVDTTAELEYRETIPGRVFRSYSFNVEHQRQWNYAGDRQAARIESSVDLTWLNFSTTSVGFDLVLPAQDQRLTRGGPLMATPHGWSANLRVSNSNRANTRANARLEYGRNEDGGLHVRATSGLTLRPTPRWQFSLEPAYERRVVDQQYVAAFDGGRLETFGRRYVFAFVDRSTVSTAMRLNYTVKPDVTLEFYGEPFAASGRFYDFGELAAPSSRQRLAYTAGGFRNPDFNVLSFRSNLVLRWEWRLGSTLYVVWQQDREESATRADRVGAADLWHAFGAAGSNILAVKTTFWLGS